MAKKKSRGFRTKKFITIYTTLYRNRFKNASHSFEVTCNDEFVRFCIMINTMVLKTFAILFFFKY